TAETSRPHVRAGRGGVLRDDGVGPAEGGERAAAEIDRLHRVGGDEDVAARVHGGAIAALAPVRSAEVARPLERAGGREAGDEYVRHGVGAGERAAAEVDRVREGAGDGD